MCRRVVGVLSLKDKDLTLSMLGPTILVNVEDSLAPPLVRYTSERCVWEGGGVVAVCVWWWGGVRSGGGMEYVEVVDQQHILFILELRRALHI